MLAVTAAPDTCSGAMYAGVPTTLVLWSPPASAAIVAPARETPVAPPANVTSSAFASAAI